MSLWKVGFAPEASAGVDIGDEDAVGVCDTELQAVVQASNSHPKLSQQAAVICGRNR